MAYILCCRFGISRELPELSRQPEPFQGRQGKEQMEVLNAIRDMSKQSGGIDKSLAPPQRSAPAPNRDTR